MRKTLWVVLALLVVTIVAPNVKADTVQVGTINVYYLASLDTGFATVTNDMSDTELQILGYTYNGAFVNSPDPVDAGTTITAIVWNDPLITLDFVGTLGNGEFTVGGVTYDDAVLPWTSPTWAGDFTGTLSIDVTATPIAATPEPSSVALMLAGIGLVLVLRKLIA